MADTPKSSNLNLPKNPDVPDSYNIITKDGTKILAHDNTPYIVETDDECREFLESLKLKIKFTEDEIKLIDKCLTVLDAEIDEDLNFGPGEYFELNSLAHKYEEFTGHILACSEHIFASIECEGDIPPDFYLKLANCHIGLGDLLEQGIKQEGIDSDSDEESFDLEDEDGDGNSDD